MLRLICGPGRPLHEIHTMQTLQKLQTPGKQIYWPEVLNFYEFGPWHFVVLNIKPMSLVEKELSFQTIGDTLSFIRQITQVSFAV